MNTSPRASACHCNCPCDLKISYNILVLSQLPEQLAVSQSTLAPATSLIDVLDHPEDVVSLQDTSSDSTKKENSPDTAPGVHSYVNRVLDRVAV